MWQHEGHIIFSDKKFVMRYVSHSSTFTRKRVLADLSDSARGLAILQNRNILYIDGWFLGSVVTLWL